jgi:hypothetical protein
VIPLRIVETDREGFDEPVVEIWRDDDFVAMVFWDDDLAIAQIYPDRDGDVYDLDLGDLFRVLGLAEAIVTPEEYRDDLDGLGGIELAVEDEAAEEEPGWEDEHPATVALVTEFDPRAAHRSAGGEGFFSRDDAFDFVARCDELDLAVVEMEGFDLEGTVPKPRPNLMLGVSLPGMNAWSLFRPAANALVQNTIADWPHRSSLVVAFVVQQPDGETFVA